jgi:caa(3)-type oxidase subunit IV
MGHSVQHYVKIWALLCGLLVISVIGPFVGEATGLYVITLVTAFGIAFYKAYLVAKNFMHLDVEKPIVWYFLATAIAFMVLFFAGVAPDVMNHDGSNWTHKSAKAEVARGLAAGSGHGGDHDNAPGAEHGTDAGHDVPQAEEAAGHH